MFASWSLLAIPAIILLTTPVEAIDVKPYIGAVAELRTECKTCPRSLCPNQLYYDYEESLNVTCWTHGTKIMGDRLWLQSAAGCYVTQYDLIEYPGEYETDLEYCGPDSEEQDLTIEDATLKYKTECRICPTISCDTVAYLPENTDVELTCWVPDGQLIIDDPYWMKTTNNCYVAQKNLFSKPDITYLDPCGPIPYLEIQFHNNENGTSDVNKRTADPAPAPELEDRGAMYLVNVTVGEEYAYCHSCAQESCKSQKRYEFNQEVYIQCVTETNGTWWTETTDFCYVKASDFWQAPVGDYYRMPLCSYFDGNGEGPGGEED